MKILQTIIVVIGVALIATFLWMGKGDKEVDTNTPPPASQTASIIGCYSVHASNDVYTLYIEKQQKENVSGSLRFDNYQKDSSSGVFAGTYKDGVLLGDYAFQSEGMDSVMQVIFKKVGGDFIRGYGPLDESGTRFSNLSLVTYDATSPLAVFKKGDCETGQFSEIIFPKGGERLVVGQKYTIRWSGGPDPIQIFLVDTSLKSTGVSVSISDRVYGIKNTGSYEYTIPKTLKEGTYEFQIGNNASNQFTVVLK